ncbi:hypothetical protein EXIGLDRAFT_220694 [Exidia glandulosa HHB12029]|uniref:Uncharacterized protein n=1 Tax=Exidia glandulosa HHB12029 TaxID=1314781 RepID=A0A165MQ23_EXIGL|nr:hypothetical protein EXIGLDRAFT_220694 [Exidia glandulosa HHB12029]
MAVHSCKTRRRSFASDEHNDSRMQQRSQCLQRLLLLECTCTTVKFLQSGDTIPHPVKAECVRVKSRTNVACSARRYPNSGNRTLSIARLISPCHSLAPPMSDVLAELFGAIPLSKLLEALESDIDDLLWALEAPLGEAAYQRIIAAQRPARELAQTMRSRKNEVPLADAFRDAVLASDKLYNLLTPGAKARVSGHGVEDTSTHASPPPPPAPAAPTHAWDAAPPSYDEHHHHARSPSPPPPPPRAVPPPPRRVASPPPPPPPQRVVSPPPPVRYQPAPPPPVQRVLTPQPPPQRIVEVDVYIPEITSAARECSLALRILVLRY